MDIVDKMAVKSVFVTSGADSHRKDTYSQFCLLYLINEVCDVYEVVGIKSFAVTRAVELKNVQTNMIEVCFDDSAVVSEDNFDFPQIGMRYECKIKLFGKLLAAYEEDCLVCKIVNAEVNVGRKTMIEVLVGSNTYYIIKNKVKNKSVGECFPFRCTRKDLIQVNDEIHADYL